MLLVIPIIHVFSITAWVITTNNITASFMTLSAIQDLLSRTVYWYALTLPLEVSMTLTPLGHMTKI